MRALCSLSGDKLFRVLYYNKILRSRIGRIQAEFQSFRAFPPTLRTGRTALSPDLHRSAAAPAATNCRVRSCAIFELKAGRGNGACAAPEAWRVRAGGLALEAGVSRPVALLESCLVEIPVVIGWLRPVILLPLGMVAGLPPGQVEAILVHELEHIRRADYVVSLL